QYTEGQNLPVYKRADKRPHQGTQPPNDDDDEDLDDDVDVHSRHDIPDRSNQGSAETGQKSAEHERGGVYDADIRSEGAEHLPVECGRAYRAPDIGALHEQPQQSCDDRPQRHDEQVVVRYRGAEEDARSDQTMGPLDAKLFRAPDR